MSRGMRAPTQRTSISTTSSAWMVRAVCSLKLLRLPSHAGEDGMHARRASEPVATECIFPLSDPGWTPQGVCAIRACDD